MSLIVNDPRHIENRKMRDMSHTRVEASDLAAYIATLAKLTSRGSGTPAT